MKLFLQKRLAEKHVVCMALCLFLISTLFSGCNQKTASGPGAIGSEIWEIVPLTYGVWESEALPILPWNSGRLEATSRNRLAETEQGFYCYPASKLYYADKANIANWVPVCNKPDCDHKKNLDCNASMSISNGFVAKDGRIYYCTDGYDQIHLYPYKGNAFMLISMAADGTDKRYEYAIEELSGKYLGGMSMLNSEWWIYYTHDIDKDGNEVRCLYYTSEEGTVLIPTDHSRDNIASLNVTKYGDPVFLCDALGSTDYCCFRRIDGELVETDLSGLEHWGAYLSSNTLRQFRPNDGYYDIDLTTREEVFLAPAQLQDSKADIALPNCIIESTLYNGEDWMADKPHEMRLFDGQKWREVSLPEELANRENGCSNLTVSVCSDSILFHFWGENSTRVLYRIPLTENELKAELCAVVG